MTIETSIFNALKGLVGNRVIAGIPKQVVAKPYITYMQVGGMPINFLDQATIPGKRRSRFQINVWGDDVMAVAALMATVENTLRAQTALQTYIETQPVATDEPDTGLYGKMQDFSFLA